VYVKSIKLQNERKDRLLAKYGAEMERDFVWGQFVGTEEPYSEFNDARNIYHRYKEQTVQSLMDKKCEDLTRTPQEFVLNEERGIIHTFKCYKKIKNLML
jgi:hypothetical protein